MISTYNYTNNAAKIFLNMDDEGTAGPVDKVGHRVSRTAIFN